MASVASATSWISSDSAGLEEAAKLYNSLVASDPPSLWILVNVNTQRLHLVKSASLCKSYMISTAKNGTGQRENSFQTPLGLHRVHSKFGDGADPLAIFKSRVATGELAVLNGPESPIVGRILTLEGLQPGFNSGQDASGVVVDSGKRGIYIHGTPATNHIGQPASIGCVRLKPEDVIELFEVVPENTPVYIYENSPASVDPED